MMNKGFTLIEMMVSVGLFAVIMTISVGTLIGVFDTNRKSESLKAAMDNLNLAIESMSREMRFSSKYSCNQFPSTNDPNPADCAGGNGGSLISFLYQNGQTIGYRWNQTTESIERWTEQSNAFIPVTAPDIIINDLKFYVVGTTPADPIQPKVLIKIRGLTGNPQKPSTQTSFAIQTQVTQRQLDF